MTNKPYWALSDEEVAFWDSEGLFSDKNESQKAIDECGRAIFKEIEPLLVSILDFISSIIVKITDLIKNRK